MTVGLPSRFFLASLVSTAKKLYKYFLSRTLSLSVYPSRFPALQSRCAREETFIIPTVAVLLLRVHHVARYPHPSSSFFHSPPFHRTVLVRCSQGICTYVVCSGLQLDIFGAGALQRCRGDNLWARRVGEPTGGDGYSFNPVFEQPRFLEREPLTAKVDKGPYPGATPLRTFRAFPNSIVLDALIFCLAVSPRYPQLWTAQWHLFLFFILFLSPLFF